MSFMRKVIISLSLSASVNAWADLDIETRKWFSFTLDNDLFVGSDGGYTNGFFLSWYDVNDIRKPEDAKALDIPWLLKLQYNLAHVENADLVVKVQNFGQVMITPTDIERTPPDPNDIPYAGALVWQGGIISANERYADFVNLLIAAVGPMSLAEQSQKLVHKVTGSTDPKGWDYQLKNEIAFSLSFSRNWRLWDGHIGAWEADFIGGGEAKVGTFISSINTSAYMRIGRALDTSYPALSLANGRQSNPIAHSHGYYLYLGLGSGYEFNDIFVDGNTFRDSPSVAAAGGNDALHFGLAFSGKKWGFTIAFEELGVLSNEREGQQQFGSFSILYRL